MGVKNLQSRDELKKFGVWGRKLMNKLTGFSAPGDSENPLNESAVHPESYKIVEKMAGDLSCTVTRPDGWQRFERQNHS